MTTRLLPPAEWNKLTGTEVESLVPGLNPLLTHVLVVEDGAEIIGTWVLVYLPHVECFWVAPEHRKKAGVAARLLREMQRLTRICGAPAPITGSVSPEVTAFIERLHGVKLPGEHFSLPLGVQ